MSDLSGRTTIVVGASRGLGHGVATAFAGAGAPVIAVSRTEMTFDGPATGSIKTEVADAADPALPGRLLETYDPEVVVLVAGANPPMHPLQEHTWESFSANWESDVKITFQWLREILLKPLKPGSRVVVFSSGAALAGSPLSGGYAGSKSTQRFITSYAQGEAQAAGMDITFTAIMPRITPATELGRSAGKAYAARGGITEDQYFAQMGKPLTPEAAGAAVVDLVKAPAGSVGAGYLLTGMGIKQVP